MTGLTHMSETTPLKAAATQRSNLSSSLQTSKQSVRSNSEEVDSNDEEELGEEQEQELSRWDTSRSYLTWLLVCFSTGPTSSMMRSYVPAAIQTTAHALGHRKDSDARCLRRGDDCYVRFGAGEVQYTSFALYLKAIYTSLEGVIAIVLMSFADYSDYRKWLMVGSTMLFGAFAIPFYWLADSEHYKTLVQQSVLYCLMLCTSTIYQITEASYIPVFMNARRAALNRSSDMKQGKVLSRGVNVSTWGLVAGNLGGIIASLVGVIITHVKDKPTNKQFLLAVTVAGFVTVVISLICGFLVPSLKGRELEAKSIKKMVMVPVIRFKTIFKDLWEYREALKYCVAWVLWNIAYSNFSSIFGLLFRSTLGIGSSDAEYTVWQFINLIVACLGPLTWMRIYSNRCDNQSSKYSSKFLKQSLYVMLTVGLFTNFWGCLGVNSGSAVGFKHRWEFWVFLILFVSTSSGVRSLNRVAYSAMLPNGKENQYFGFEIMLGLCTGWSESLIVAVIQDKTGNSRMPFIPNTVLYVVAIVMFYFVDLEKGMKNVEKWD